MFEFSPQLPLLLGIAFDKLRKDPFGLSGIMKRLPSVLI